MSLLSKKSDNLESKVNLHDTEKQDQKRSKKSTKVSIISRKKNRCLVISRN